MKNFTSSIRKLFFLSFLFLFSGFFAKALEFDPHDWHLVSQNTTDGYVTIDVERYDGGTEIDHNLYLQVNNEGEWETIWHYRHYTDSDGKNWYSQDYAEWYIDHIDRGRVDVDADGYREYVTRLRIRRSPTGVYNSPVSFRWREEGTVKDNFSFTFYKPKGPGNLQASRGLCNRIELSWDEPSNTRSNGSNSYYIYRDGFYLGSTSSRSYTWNSPADGTEYDFSVRMLTSYNSVTNYGEYSMEVAGNSKPRPEAPTNVIASSDLCDGTIKIDWQWTSETPDNFQIQRSTSSGGGYTTLSSTVPGDRNYYEDTPPAQNTTYYYRVRARNDCGDWGTYSTPASGVAPAAPADPSNVQYSLLGNIVQITWNDNSFNEEKFVVTRTNLNTGVTNEFEVDADTEVHEDDKAQLCIPYEYEIEAVNNCGSSNKVSSGDVILSPDLSNTFPEGSFKTSKGFFPDVVRLEWDNNNRNQINSYYIYRKVYGSNDSTLLATLDGALASYEDEYAENGVVYEYSIKAEGLCDTLSVWSNVIADIGFQNPAGVVSGKITYGSGEPVKGITVTAESSELLETSSMALNGYSSYMEIPHNSSFEIQDAFTFQAYVRMSAIQSSSIFNKGSQYQLDYTGSAFEFSVGGDVLTYSFTMPVDKFVHITAVFDGSSSHLYLDGELVRTKTNVASPASNNSPLVIGRWNGSDYLSGYIDEIRLWKTALDSATISNDFNRYISFRHNDLLGYYRLNENIPIDVFFDISKSDLTFNENHGTLVDCSYSSVVPEKQQLWFRGLTDENGDYLITGIPYLTDGSSFNIVPMLSPHEFNPASKTLFLSDESQVHNNIDFTDISSFKVNGSVVYRNTTLGVEGVYILVDGEMVFGPDNKPEVTNEKGEFEIQVPIGSHYISLRKDGHSFADGGRWPFPIRLSGTILTKTLLLDSLLLIPLW